ncbi:MAG: spore coat protein U domain-containing protein [Proteobacteria bacterium]|nr:spore coat protein U domain-containing protein [Pseudomonadota bacterium]
MAVVADGGFFVRILRRGDELSRATSSFSFLSRRGSPNDTGAFEGCDLIYKAEKTSASQLLKRCLHKTRAARLAAFWISVALFLGVAPSGEAFAQNCTASVTNMAFGSFNPLTGAKSTTATLSVNCTGTKSKTLRFCVSAAGTSPTGCRSMVSGSNQLAFDLYTNAAHSTQLGDYRGAGSCPSGSWDATGLQFNLTLNASGSGSTTKTIYAGLNDATAVPGSYTATYSGSNIAVDYVYNTGASCPVTSPQTVQPAFNISATVQAACNVNATDMNFGSPTLLNANVDQTSTITVQCTNSTPFNVGLNTGNGGGATVTARKMTSGVNTIVYSLYQDAARSTVWGNTVGTDTASGIGTGANQPLTVYGRVPPQVTPVPATYTDTIIVTITY